MNPNNHHQNPIKQSPWVNNLHTSLHMGTHTGAANEIRIVLILFSLLLSQLVSGEILRKPNLFLFRGHVNTTQPHPVHSEFANLTQQAAGRSHLMAKAETNLVHFFKGAFHVHPTVRL